MKFITEDDLRDLYKKQPFKNYDLRDGERLTPGARQFLLDRGIDMYDRNDPYAAVAAFPKDSKLKTPAEADVRKSIFRGKWKSLQSLFLLTAKDLMASDVCMSQQVTGLYRKFCELRSAMEGGVKGPELCCSPCTGINCENFSQCLGDCFEVTDFHMQMEKGREMLLLDRLKSELQLFGAEAEQLLEDKKHSQALSEDLNRIINTISQMICAAMGGSECQRKM